MLKVLNSADSAVLLGFELKNQSYFEQFVPPRPDGFLTLAGMEGAVSALIKEMASGQGWYFVLWRHGEIVGRFNFSKCSEGCFELGYRVGQSDAGKGLASSGLILALEHMKSKSNVRVIVAETTPNNKASIRVLQKCGFIRQGAGSGAAMLHGKKVDLIRFEFSWSSRSF
ncbi:MAG: GNAT family N-acetyltransferase [Devosiaceae bacterium]|nr:GNAT family N-acetyltransferase [Devosiaceae bacterium]